MRTDIRECGSTSGFNTGMNYCPLQPDKVAGVILVIHGKKLPKELTADVLEEACHADYPDRIYPITGFSEYAVSGGEPNTSENGYAGSEITGYSARTDTFTLRKFNLALQANLVANKDTLFDMYVFDKNNVIYGEDDGTDELAGFDLSGVYPTGQTYDSSGQKAYLAFNAMYSDTLLNPEFAEKQRQEQEISSLKGQMSEMSKNMSDLMELNKRLMEQLGVVETSKTKK